MNYTFYTLKEIEFLIRSYDFLKEGVKVPGEINHLKLMDIDIAVETLTKEEQELIYLMKSCKNYAEIANKLKTYKMEVSRTKNNILIKLFEELNGFPFDKTLDN